MFKENAPFRLRPSERTIHVLKDHTKSLERQGLLIGAIGLMAILLPEIATIAIALAVGWLFLALGFVRFVFLWQLPAYPGRTRSLVTATLAIALGLVLLFHPFAGALTLTMALVLFFVAEGVIVTAVALGLKPHLSIWPGILASGILNFVLAAAILAGWPGTADWAVGLLVGINLLSVGVSLLLLGRGVRQLP